MNMATLVTPTTTAASQSGRIASMLGFKDASMMDDVALADRIASGLGVRSAETLGKTLGPVINVVGDIIPEATFRRIKTQKKSLSREMSERLYELSRVWDAAYRMYAQDGEKARSFLTRPHPLLDGRTPLSLTVGSSAGADAVANLLLRAEAGFSV